VIGSYEEERATPPLTCLIEISEMFKVSLDTLTRRDISKISEKDWKSQPFSKGREVLSISVDKEGNENVELVSQKASAGYLNGYADPEFIAELPKISLPVLPRNVTYRAFEIKGDSMLPVQPGSIVFGEYLENISSIKNGALYIFITKDEGIVFKRVFILEKERKVLLVSDNRHYAPYTVDLGDILEIWSAKGFFTTKFPEIQTDGLSLPLDHLAATVVALQNEVQRLKKKQN
jgi:phage repressor protein C with HTH and peptisase S24 domain